MSPGVVSPAEIARALRVDRAELGKLAGRIERARREGKPHDRNLRRLAERLELSVKRRERKAALTPAIVYPEELPISERRAAIAEAIRSHPVVVVCGETGSGKSTQLPKILLELGYGRDGMIGHTQPRRIAARSLARRLAQELKVKHGAEVGHKVRFADETGPDTMVAYMTDGVLLAETRRDRRLDRYDAIIVDEAHERSLNIDVLLGYLARLLPRRPDLKLVVTSATIDPDSFARFFTLDGKPAPVVEVSGRAWPVDVRWSPPTADSETGEVDLLSAVVDTVTRAAREEQGDLLVFLPTQRDIQEAAKLLEGRGLADCKPAEIVPLYARLTPEQQYRVFEAGGKRRRIVLATNVAESSVTVPGIHIVVDTGTARISRWSTRGRLQRLPIEPVSRASADQRMGRCGRLGPGVCYRLFDEDDYASREAFTTPEIQRSNLAAVVLQLAALGLGQVADFPWVDPPRAGLVAEGIRTLHELGALDARERLTPLGRELAKLPVDPRIGRMILAARDEGCLAEMLIIAAALETSDPRDRPPGFEARADAAHAVFNDPESDVMGLLALWDGCQALRKGKSRRAAAVAMKAAFLSANRFREWADVRRQLEDLVREAGMTPGQRRGNREAVHRALLAGMLSLIAQRTDKYEYTGADGSRLHLWPGSALFEKRPRWIVATEIVQTTRRYARGVARIDPRVLETLAGDLCRSRWRQPRWERKAGRVMALETVSLFGLVIVPKRRAPYSAVDPVRCRQLFLRHALVEGDFDTGAAFLSHNLELVTQVATLAAKVRDVELVADADARLAFYDARIPDEVTDATTFHRWRKRAEQRDPDLLFMTREDLLEADSGHVTFEAFPDALEVPGASFPLRYKHDPGEEDDGVSIRIPLADLGRLPPQRLEWLVPGMLREKVIALLRTLPKELRRPFVPIPQTVDSILAGFPFGQGALLAGLSHALQRACGRPVPESAFESSKIPEHLRMHVEVVDGKGVSLARGRDLEAVEVLLEKQVGGLLEGGGSWRRDGVTAWDFGDLPARLTLRRQGLTVTAWPAIVDRGKSVSLRLREQPHLAAAETHRGVRRLFALAARRAVVGHLQRDSRWGTMVLQHALLPDVAPLADMLVDRVADLTFVRGHEPITGDDAFAQRLSVGRHRLELTVQEVLPPVAAVLAASSAALAALVKARRKHWEEAVEDEASHLGSLLGGRFAADLPWRWISHVPRFLAAVQRRFDRLEIRGSVHDARLAERLVPHARDCQELAYAFEARGVGHEDLDLYRWMVEELRVSLFAQELGTSMKVSPKRLEAQRAKVVEAARGL